MLNEKTTKSTRGMLLLYSFCGVYVSTDFVQSIYESIFDIFQEESAEKRLPIRSFGTVLAKGENRKFHCYFLDYDTRSEQK